MRVTSAEKYVAAACLVVLSVALLYIVLYAFKLARLERALVELPVTKGEQGEHEEVQSWPAS
jgi:hypothetical protein